MRDAGHEAGPVAPGPIGTGDGFHAAGGRVPAASIGPMRRPRQTGPARPQSQIHTGAEFPAPHPRYAMKLSALLTAMAIGTGAALAAGPGDAQGTGPCAAYLCMAGLSGEGAAGGAACAPATGIFFSLAVFDPFFDGPATALLRRQYLLACPGADLAANAAVLDVIIATWGTVP